MIKKIFIISTILFSVGVLCLTLHSCSDDDGGSSERSSGYLINIPDGVAK